MSIVHVKQRGLETCLVTLFARALQLRAGMQNISVAGVSPLQADAVSMEEGCRVDASHLTADLRCQGI